MILLILRSLRPRQWTKNIVVYAALIFAQRLFVVSDLLRVSAAFVLFCLVSGAVYLINDVLDREEDACHPRKKFRPVASG